MGRGEVRRVRQGNERQGGRGGTAEEMENARNERAK